jgi:hypothetical protein
LDDEEMREQADSVKRLILCSGKIYTELVASEAREQDGTTAVARVELLYPFPEGGVRAIIDGYPNLEEVIWVQEEPRNMGAWGFVEPLLRELLDGELPVRYVGKRPVLARRKARRGSTRASTPRWFETPSEARMTTRTRRPRPRRSGECPEPGRLRRRRCRKINEKRGRACLIYMSPSLESRLLRQRSVSGSRVRGIR